MRPRPPSIIGLLLAVGAVAACQPDDGAPDETAAAGEAAESGARVVDVTARDFAFEVPTEIPSGWTTFRMENAGQQEHFLVLWRLPEGTTFADYRDQVVPAFDSIMEPYRAGTVDRAQALETLGGLLPEWYGGVTAAGGPGLIAPGGVVEATVNLEPGTYVMECYVKTPEGEFHGSLGMLVPLTVTESSSPGSPPEADLRMTLSNYEIAIEGEPTSGRHTVRVDYVDDPEGLLPHDVHLVRLEGEDAVEPVVAWMDWMDELRAPAPSEFLGGTEQMTAGNTAYLTVELEPGRYAWVSESYGDRGMVREFTVE